MKTLCILLLSLLSIVVARAQSSGSIFPLLDKSPMDISYYPPNYPVLKIQDKISEPLIARVIYSRPLSGDRTIFGGLVEYGKLWRIGANEATELEFFHHVRIGDKKIPKGRYTLYAMVNEDNWTIILNKETDTWGAFKYNTKKDILRMEIPVQRSDLALDALAMVFEKTSNGANLVIAWENIKVSLPIIF